MMPAEEMLLDTRQKHARRMVRMSLVIAFTGAMLGVIFGVVLGEVKDAEALLIGVVTAVTGGLLVIVFVRPVMATGLITGVLTIYLVVHLNAGAILAYQPTGDIGPIFPYITWFFPLVVFHQFTNFGFYKRPISILVGLGPLPAALFVLTNLHAPAELRTLDVTVTFLVSFLSFVLCVGIYARHRDQEILHVAQAEETERSADALRISEERFRLLSVATDDLIWDADLVARTMWWNDTLVSYGYDPKVFRGDINAWERWIHPDERDRIVKSLYSTVASGKSSWTSEYRFICADGRLLNVIARGLIIRNENGKPVRMIGSLTDVTQLRALEQKLRQSQKLEAVGQLTGGIAHDFNNLLTVIMGSAEDLKDIHADSPRARELAETTLQASERAATLISRLLAFARLQPLAPERVDPAALLKDIEGLIRRTIKEDIEISIVAAGDVWLIEIDRSQLENAILNLVINARDAMPDGGRVLIEVSNATLEGETPGLQDGAKGGNFVMFAVSDNGSGMPKDIVDRAFDPFFTTKESGRGSGLGLSMVWGFVQQSNGLAQIYSEPGEGTTVKLYFPSANEQQLKEEAPMSVSGLTGGTEHILVVEDEELVRRHVVTQLRDLGYTISEASSAAKALEIMDSGKTFDLLFSDMIMPGGMNGRQLVDAALERQPGLKVLFTSGYTENAIAQAERLDPNVNLLSKPYRRADLAAKVRLVLDA